MVLVMSVMVSSGGGCGCGGGRGRDAGAVVAVTGRDGRGGCGGRQVMTHSRVVRPSGHGRCGTEPVRGVRHLTACGQVAVSHGRVVHVGRGRGGAGQTVKVGLVQVRVVHDDCALSRTVISSGSAHVRDDVYVSTRVLTMQLLQSTDNRARIYI